MKIQVQFSCFLLWFLVFLVPKESRSQLTVVQGSAIGLTPLEFVQNYLVGSGVTISNATYNGSSEPLNSTNRLPLKARDQIGSFSNAGMAQTQLGISGGVVLSSGYAEKTKAGSNPSDDMWGNSQPAESDPDLVILAGNTIHDKSVLEFDFIPQTDAVTFRYVFGSIEFDAFCGSINDAFGLFLSGPGISGGLGFVNNAVNIALLPTSINYVTIFNICAADQGNLGSGLYSWWNVKKDFYSFNRLTYVFTATYTVVCNQTYHMKFAIGDAQDGVLDSGVFLEQNSFSSNTFAPATNFSNPSTGTLLVPGCSTTDLSYTIPQAKTSDLVIDLAIHGSGTATQADILPNPFPAQVIIPAGQTQSPVITIQALPAGIPGPDKILVIKASVTTCAGTNSAMNDFTIKYNDILSAAVPPVTSCSGSSSTLTAIVAGGQQAVPSNTYNYLWSNALTTSSITLSPGPGHHPYSVTVTDACNQTMVANSWIDVGTVPGAAGPITGPVATCTPASGLVYSVPPLSGADDYVWTLPPGATITAGNNSNSITVDFSVAASSGNISVKGHNIYCGDGPPVSVPLTINPSPVPAGTISGLNTVCQGSAPVIYSVTPVTYATGYDWSVPAGVTIVSGAGTNQVSCIFTPSAVSGNISVRGVNPDCGYGIPSVMAVTVNPLPGNAGPIVSVSGSVVCQGQSGVTYSIGAVSSATEYIWTYTGTGAAFTNNGNILVIDFSAAATSGNLRVTGRNSCGDGLQSPSFAILVNPKPVVSFNACNAVITTKNGRPIYLKGGHPAGSRGIYSGTGVAMASPGVFVFDPANSSVIGGGTSNAVSYPVKYTYTNIHGCADDQSISVAVYGSNANDPCPGTVKDHRDNQVYPTFPVGSGINSRCWMAADLNAGSFIDKLQSQTDNCLIEKYCLNDLAARCDLYGGRYQWGEIMEYHETGTYQDICPAGWHVSTMNEWDNLVNASSGDGLAGSALKDVIGANGFHGLLEGMLYGNSTWVFGSGQNTGTMYWTTVPVSANYAAARGLNIFNPSVSYYPSGRANAFAVRCVRN